MIFCTTCGHPRNGPVHYCTSCGAPFPDGAGGEPAVAEQVSGARHRAGARHRPDTMPAHSATAPAHSATAPAHSGAVMSRPAAGRVAGQGQASQLLQTRDRGGAGLADRLGIATADRDDRAEPRYLAPDFPADLPSAPVSVHGRRRKAAVAALGAAVVLIAAAGGVDVVLMHRHHAASSAASALTTPGGPVSRGVNGSASAQPPSSAPSRTATPAPGTAGIVTVAPGISKNPDAARVEDFVGRYFTAINNHNYQQFRPLLGEAMRQDEPAAKFYPGYESTTDSAAVLTAISDISPGLVGAAVSFTSHQLPADTPSGSACTNWSITLYLSQHGSRYELEPPPPGYRAVYQPC